MLIGFDKSTVSRELKRNRDESGYKPKAAEKLTQSRQSNAHKASKKNEAMDEIIVKKLKLDWSPGSISERLKVEKKTEVEQLNHTRIYRRIAKEKAQGGLYLYLPNTGKTRWKGGPRVIKMRESRR